MKTICIVRDLYKALEEFENNFERIHALSINEAMVLCALREFGGCSIPTEIGKRTGIRNSYLSKILRRLEEKGVISRSLGEEDRRQMYFALTSEGTQRLQQLYLDEVEIPERLRPLF